MMTFCIGYQRRDVAGRKVGKLETVKYRTLSSKPPPSAIKMPNHANNVCKYILLLTFLLCLSHVLFFTSLIWVSFFRHFILSFVHCHASVRTPRSPRRCCSIRQSTTTTRFVRRQRTPRDPFFGVLLVVVRLQYDVSSAPFKGLHGRPRPRMQRCVQSSRVESGGQRRRWQLIWHCRDKHIDVWTKRAG